MLLPMTFTSTMVHVVMFRHAEFDSLGRQRDSGSTGTTYVDDLSIDLESLSAQSHSISVAHFTNCVYTVMTRLHSITALCPLG